MKKAGKNLILIFILTAVIFGTGTMVLAEEESEGREIMKEVYNRETGEDRKATMEMILINRHGDERRRELRQFERDFEDVEKRIMFFTSPEDVRGTSFMNWSYDDGGDDQWLYLPALGRIRRISGEQRSDSFMGTDFTYEDMGERDIDEDKHRLLREETVDDKECYVVENIPVEEDYMYSKTITWVVKDENIALQKKFYDQDEELLKILQNKKYGKVDGIITIFESEMHDIQDDHKTIIKLSEVEYNTGITEDQFTERMMRRGL